MMGQLTQTVMGFESSFVDAFEADPLHVMGPAMKHGYVDGFIIMCCVIGMAFAGIQYMLIKRVSLDNGMLSQDSLEAPSSPEQKLISIYHRIMEGAKTFLREEYRICGGFCVLFGIIIWVLVWWGSTFGQGALTAVAFWVGASTSMLCGYLGMMIATFSNAGPSIYKNFEMDMETVMDCVAGYGLGGSTVAMFGRVGGGIYTKAADVGADLVGKVVAGLEEDDPSNPATIADNVGDNVGDIAGMGADLFGSFAESTCAALVIAASVAPGADVDKFLSGAGWDALLFPVTISSAGIVVCMICSFVATDIKPVRQQADIETVLKVQMVLTALLMLPATWGLAEHCLPAEFDLTSVRAGAKVVGTPLKAFACAALGTVGGLIIGLCTEYYTSHTYVPVQELATACKSGTAVNIIFGLALGYKSCIVPVFVLAANIYVAFSLCDLYGIALAALGMLSTLATGLTIDGFGPISDNAGGIAELAEFPSEVRDRTDALDAAGNTTAAIGKGFAIGSAALVSLALFGAFVVRLKGLNNDLAGVDVLQPITFSFFIIGSMVPYWFAALTMKSVGKAAGEMVEEVKRQFALTDNEGLTILSGSTVIRPDYDRCITISTKSSLHEMIAPGALVIGAPLVAGTFFGFQAVFGLLTGSLGSSVQLAISMSNSGGAWDNCKKYIKGGFAPDPELRYVKHPRSDEEVRAAPKAREAHDAAVQGDTVGDPFKDTSGPALNIVMKLQAIVSLVFAAYFSSCGHG
eukprot:CAMPEP_0206518454 /NCGR_PEP_ID=MMETSP0324_2-20121206/64587_1 /ASSEMBLY_ACC=CAM_ASM_000836 /TAXON_ID=2866 /ORGANISM="Crypthecodinium cohnii, Strain Seligo" /LENGTH=746 /DNA_ID=CAMNT_0054011811 /DNA_START=153 /DNA_END=2391 /DNA_ORIENTATION=-